MIDGERSKKVLKSIGRLLPDRMRVQLYRMRHPGYRVRTARPPTYNADGMMTWHNSDFQKDPRFMAAYKVGEATGSWNGRQIPWRAYVGCWAADQVKHLDGDFVECGVNRGGLARAICEYVDFKASRRTFYLLDTFRGLVEDMISDEEKKLGWNSTKNGYYVECYEDVVKTFRDFPNVKIIRGPVPDTLPQVDAERVCFLSIDMNCAAPEIAAAEYFWDKVVSGGIVLLDDYGFATHETQKEAFDQFAARKGVQVLSLPTGQGLLIKP